MWVYCAVTGSFNIDWSSLDDSGIVSGPNGSGGRSTSGDTGEGQLVRVKGHISRYRDVPFGKMV